MKMKMAVAAVLALTSVGFVAPAVEAGRSTPTLRCTFVWTSGSTGVTIDGTWEGIRYGAVRYVLVNVAIAPEGFSDYAVQSQTSRTSGAFSKIGTYTGSSAPNVFAEIVYGRQDGMRVQCTPSV